VKCKHLEKIEMLGLEAVAQFNTCFKKIKENEMTWQPIETAPKDGTVVIVRGFYDADGKLFMKAAAAQYSKSWMRDNHGYGYTVSCYPTLWMPLPELTKGE
jgi:hypothetical protein